MPSFQTDIYDVYSHEDVAVIAINQDGSLPALLWYVDDLTTKSVQLTYPFAYDNTDLSFQDYDADILPSIFLIDQNGLIRLRFDGATDSEHFLPELEEILETIEELLAE